VELVLSSLAVMTDVIEHLSVKKDVMSMASNKSYAISLDIAEVLVTRYKVPFRAAHKLVGALVNLSVKKKDEIPFKSLTSSDIKYILSKETAITADKVIKAIRGIDSKRSLTARHSKGAPNPTEQRRIIKQRKLLVQRYSNEVQKKKEMVDKVKENITNTIKSIIIHK
jgi:argininosuccinate lyase